MTEKTESNGKKESVKLRERLLEDGTKSLYLDIQHNGKRSREFLKLYLLEGTSKIIKEQNRQTMAQAEAIRAQRQIELQSGSYEVLHQFKPNTYFLAYYRKMCEEHFQSDSEGNWGIWRSCLRYLESYCDESTTFNEITTEWVKGFKRYLDTVEKDTHKSVNEKNGEHIFIGLSQNSKHSYFNKLKACINHAFDERIIAVNPLRGVKGFKQDEVMREHLSWEEVCMLDAEQPPYNIDEYDLALAINEEETNGYLVTVYETGKVCRVAMKELFEKTFFTNYKRVDEKMIFACPASEDDYLLTTLRDENGYMFYRTDKVESLQRVRITDPGVLMHPVLKYEVVFAEIIPARLAQYCKATPGKALGISALTGTGPKLREDLNRELGTEIMPLNI